MNKIKCYLENIAHDDDLAISIIMPAYNASKFIGESIESVVNQTFDSWELIVVDDGSTDETANIVSIYAKRVGPKIRCLEQENSGHPACARNKGIRNAVGGWVAFLDSDDYWERDHLLKLFSCAKEDRDVGVVYGSKIWVDQTGNVLPAKHQPDYHMPGGWIFENMFFNNLMNTSSVLVKKEILFKVGLFNESPSLRNVQDYDLFLRLAAVCKVASVPDLKYFYRRHDSNVTLNSSRRARGLITAIDNAIGWIKAGKVDINNKIEGIDAKERLKQVYEHSVLSTYYNKQYFDMIKFAIESASRGIVTKKMLQKLIFSCFPSRLRDSIRRAVRA